MYSNITFINAHINNFRMTLKYCSKECGFLQFINIVVNLLDALKTSFSHRSLAARSLGKKDSISEAAVASLTLVKVKKQNLSTKM